MRVIYVSYDGALDPLGASQVVPYLQGLSRLGISFDLLSFEKEAAWRDVVSRERLQASLQGHGISWRPLPYHKRPRLPATVWDLWRGASTLASIQRESGASLVHCRGDVAMAMARMARLPSSVAILYDVRGLFSDERVESGSWRRGSLLDRMVRWTETGNLDRADGIVTLTRAAIEVLARRRSRLPPCRVIPTCADVSIFTPRTDVEPEFGLAYNGSLGTWYMTAEMVAFARVAARFVAGRPLFLTPQADVARAAGATPDWCTVASASPAEVPAWLRRARGLFYFIRPSPAKRASCPTKLAEGLATGLPVLTNRGIGDLDEGLERDGIGVLVEDFSTEAYERAAARMADLIADPGTSHRCRSFAEKYLSLEVGVTSYRALYETLSPTSLGPRS